MTEPLGIFLPHLRRYVGMYVAYTSYVTVCGFIGGYAQGSGEDLRDFHTWLVGRGTTRPELAWPSLVLTELYPPDALPDPRDFTREQDEQALKVLFDLLQSYYESRCA